jgi:Ca2+-binding EF-hand superfamily protein
MKRRVWTALIAFAISVSIAISTLADTLKGYEARHADKNRDGRIDKRELRMQKEEEARHNKALTWREKRAGVGKDSKVYSKELPPWKRVEKERVDTDSDGKIDMKENRTWWKDTRHSVTTPAEKRYDNNQNGWLEPEEMKKILSDKYAAIKAQGQAKVDTDMEFGYDTDTDGVIDSKEAEELKKDLGES